MPHSVEHRNQHCSVRQTMMAVAGGVRRRNRPRKCEALLGCTVEALVQRLGFVAGDKRHLDHIVPLSQGGDHHFTNLRLLPPGTHMRRRAQATPEEVAAVSLLRLHCGSRLQLGSAE